MGFEERFVTRIQDKIRKQHPRALMFKINDRMTIGIPDLIIFNGSDHYAIEVKGIARTPKKADPKNWLPHGFSMPQILTLKDLDRNSCIALGIIYVADEDVAYILLPQDLRPDKDLTWTSTMVNSYHLPANHLTSGSENTILSKFKDVHQYLKTNRLRGQAIGW